MRHLQRSQHLLALLALLTLVQGSTLDHFDELWGLSKGSHGSRRSGRRLLTRDLNMEEIFKYWQKMYGHWPTEKYGEYLSEYRRRVVGEGRSWGLPKSDEDFLDIYYFLRNRTEVPHAPGWSPQVDKCGPTCHLYGTCNQEQRICYCPRGREGPDCSTRLPTSCHRYCQHEGQCLRVIREWCINECNGRGACVGGVCHCWPGYFGSDCSLSVDYDGRQGGRAPGATVLLAGLNYSDNPRGPRIYVYEFPPQMHLWGHTWVDRPLNIILWERLSSLGLREVDPARADYFFIPGCGRGCNKWDDKFKFILEHYGKYWQRHHGRDHIMTHPGDWGRCERAWGDYSVPFIANLTMLQHWGITVDRSKEVDHDLFRPCYLPSQDILVPPMCGDLYSQFEFNVWHPNRKRSPVKKSILASVAGSICGWNSVEEPPCKNRFYSLGVRAALWQLRDTPGFHIAKRVPAMGQSMAESEFCFAPTGAGYGKRNVISATLGCMPVIISDHVAQPYEPFLNWNEFGVWIAEEHVGDVEAILRGFTPAQKAEKMEKLYCAARHLAFTSVYGNLFDGDSGEFDAIATLIHILRARKRHPDLPDHKLMEVDHVFADFMACKHRDLLDTDTGTGAALGGGGGSGGYSGAAPPAPPLPAAAVATAKRRGRTVDDEAFPQRTMTTAEWIRAVNGGRGGGGGGGGGAGASGSAQGELCMFNERWVYYADHEVPTPDNATIAENTRERQCPPKNANRPAGFPPGASITCPPTGPITQCARLV